MMKMKQQEFRIYNSTADTINGPEIMTGMFVWHPQAFTIRHPRHLPDVISTDYKGAYNGGN